MLNVVFYRFHNNDGIIDNNPDGEYQSEQGKGVDRKAKHRKYNKCPDE